VRAHLERRNLPPMHAERVEGPHLSLWLTMIPSTASVQRMTPRGPEPPRRLNPVKAVPENSESYLNISQTAITGGAQKSGLPDVLCVDKRRGWVAAANACGFGIRKNPRRKQVSGLHVGSIQTEPQQQ